MSTRYSNLREFFPRIYYACSYRATLNSLAQKKTAEWDLVVCVWFHHDGFLVKILVNLILGKFSYVGFYIEKSILSSKLNLTWNDFS